MIFRYVMSDNLQNLISNTLRDLIVESGDILTTGAFGSGGRSKSFVASAKARAESDPEGLMKDLRVTSPVAGSDLEKVQKILNAAIHGNDIMSQAYRGVKMTDDTPVNSDKPVRVLAVSLGEIDRKNGLRFLAHTLRAAKNANFLNLKDSVQFAQGKSNAIVIYSVEQ